MKGKVAGIWNLYINLYIKVTMTSKSAFFLTELQKRLAKIPERGKEVQIRTSNVEDSVPLSSLQSKLQVHIYSPEKEMLMIIS